MFDLRATADMNNAASLSAKLRRRRFAWFEALIENLPKPIRLIDIGGTEIFWERSGWAGRDDVDITAINQSSTTPRYANLRTVRGDAVNLSEYPDNMFDVAFSNSVIEHLFTEEKQLMMASEVRRLAKAYWVQTPNFWFPMEPHFHIPGWQWLPRRLRIAMIQRWRCGWRGPCPELDQAAAAVDEVRLLTPVEMRAIFPGAQIWHERFAGLGKSIVAYDGFGLTLADTAVRSRVTGTGRVDTASL